MGKKKEGKKRGFTVGAETFKAGPGGQKKEKNALGNTEKVRCKIEYT